MHLPSGMPLVGAVRDRNTATPFGETTITETKEGHDDSEIASHLGTPFGETTLTKTSEGRDETETTFMSNFGETTYTASREGTDQGETPLAGCLPGEASISDIQESAADAGSGISGSNRLGPKEGAATFVPAYTHF